MKRKADSVPAAFRRATFVVFVAFFLCLPSCPRAASDILGSGCSDTEDTADLCLEGSGSGDLGFELPWEGEDQRGRKVCRSSSLPTWFPNSNAGLREDFYSMIQACARVPEDGVTLSKCESVDHHFPVNGMATVLPVTSLSSNLTYFNLYCFVCSEDPGPEVTWSVNVSCSRWVSLQSLGSEEDVLRAALNSPDCWVLLQPPDTITIQTCLPEISGPPGLQGEINPRGSPLSLLLDFRRERADDNPSSDENTSSMNKNTWPCSGKNEFYLESVDRCLPMRCEEGKRMVDSKCQSVIRRSRGLSYSLTLTFDAFINLHDVKEGHPTASLTSQCTLEEVLKSGVIGKMPMLHSGAYSAKAHVQTNPQVPRTSGEVFMANDSDLYFEESPFAGASDGWQVGFEDNGETTDQGATIFWGNVVLWLDFVVTHQVEREDVENTVLRMSSQDWHVTCGETHARLRPTLSRRPDGDIPGAGKSNNSLSDREMFWMDDSNPEYTDFLAQDDRKMFAVSPFLLCPFIVFLPDDYAVWGTHTDTANVTVLNVSVSLSRNDYRISATNELHLCKSTFIHRYLVHLTGFNKLNNTRDHSKTNGNRASLVVITEHYLSLASVSLSLTGLLATFMTYALFRSLRTLPGKNTMALCANLFIAQASLQFGIGLTDLEIMCVGVGMLVHYFWLASLLWMNVCSFHMRKVFTAKRSPEATSGQAYCCSRRFVCYLLYAQGVSALGLGATAASTILVTGGRDLGYGGPVCYLSSPFLVGVAFVLPLVLVVVVNLVFFLQAVRAIARDGAVLRRHHGQSPLVQNGGHRDGGGVKVVPSSWRRNLNASVRLSSLTGLFWTLGLLAEVLDVSALRLASVIVNGSQGVLIAASYLPTRRVARLYRNACCPCLDVSQPASAAATNQSSANNSGSTTLSSFGSRGSPQTSRL